MTYSEQLPPGSLFLLFTHSQGSVDRIGGRLEVPCLMSTLLGSKNTDYRRAPPPPICPLEASKRETLLYVTYKG